MRANFRMHRLFVEARLHAGGEVTASKEQANHLANVLRLADQAEILVFNGIDGEWKARLSFPTKKRLVLTMTDRARSQPPAPDLVYCFAPLKVGRLDYMVQKAVEMGAGILQPVFTHHTQLHRVKVERLQANAVEAAQQCGVLAVPAVREPVKLKPLLDAWPSDRTLIFCDEGARTQNPLDTLKRLDGARFALLVGPEGGFSEEERTLLSAHANVMPIPLGPRILRADTAAVAAMAVLQATIGDWH
ncbi:16S rRNA (uracil(1498)-N(3))-methyltransferase [Pararhizobium mangrovi]|uniref:Ribosomal RNA small subunit methyltransferase E n=1 Tax=Pararhizobium mangrovi TaxID=2590452 RepID=A0A506U290_9HYPH|nr:16S rRNA (uracil(1498)-N(3))-methyltransferase [Pararhizobium mangrovi]TPW27391.1 16S rRNA (uracil(1498)-N(3))-methyltransferase [Pararhizobium mangrovi]